jgi:3-dehydroquinate synthase
MQRYDYEIPLTFKHRICFTRHAFAAGNRVVAELLEEGGGRKVLVFLEEAVAEAWPQLAENIAGYVQRETDLEFRGVLVLEGAERIKADDTAVRWVWDTIEEQGIDRHSYILAVGGGAFLDAVGYGAATAHRGVRLIRLPTTTLSQDDSGVGVKNGINAYGKKNFLGTFNVPFAVVNDFAFLHTQPADTRRFGLVEALKVALVKDGRFFEWMEDQAAALAELKPAMLEEAVERSAILHAGHIAQGGDPFESGSSRPLDFGHWSAHKLEQLTAFKFSHGEAVAVGVALDTIYSRRTGRLSADGCERVLSLIETLRLPLWHDMLDAHDGHGRRLVYAGLEEFREHLGGRLTVLLLRDLGRGEDVHEMDEAVLDECIDELRQRTAVAV